ncbi:hypothetical protein [Phenylobacterium immobile]|uniref:hypothetical protein n=1 Tax=Phenylobacterium immobile TaxID=21 RepID=UPI000AEE328A|nr:hypothetical protein [Phenylobacterium immobile]
MTKSAKAPLMKPYKGPAGGYGSAKSGVENLLRGGLAAEGALLLEQPQPERMGA